MPYGNSANRLRFEGSFTSAKVRQLLRREIARYERKRVRGILVVSIPIAAWLLWSHQIVGHLFLGSIWALTAVISAVTCFPYFLRRADTEQIRGHAYLLAASENPHDVFGAIEATIYFGRSSARDALWASIVLALGRMSDSELGLMTENQRSLLFLKLQGIFLNNRAPDVWIATSLVDVLLRSSPPEWSTRVVELLQRATSNTVQETIYVASMLAIDKWRRRMADRLGPGELLIPAGKPHSLVVPVDESDETGQP